MGKKIYNRTKQVETHEKIKSYVGRALIGVY